MINSDNRTTYFRDLGLLALFIMLNSIGMSQDSLIVSVDSNSVDYNDSISVIESDSIVDTNKFILNKVSHSNANKGKGIIRIIQDERINTLDRIIKANPYEHEGFRIQIVFGTQSVVNSKQASFRNKFSYRTYKDFLAPNFRLRVGDFATKQLAEKHLYRIRRNFPDAYIVKDTINTPSEYR